MKKFFSRTCIIALLAINLLSSQAAQAWDETWRKPYPVGTKLMCSPSYNPADWREGVVTENTPGGSFRVEVPAGNGYPGGVFIISGASAVKPLGGGDAQPSPPATTSHLAQATQPARRQSAPQAPKNYDQSFASHADAQKCTHNEAGLKQILLEMERAKLPLQKPTMHFQSFSIGAELSGFDPGTGLFMSPGEARVGKRHTKTVIPVRTRYTVHEHYTDSTKVTEFDNTFYFYKDEVGECVPHLVKGKFLDQKFLPAGTP